MIRELQYMSQRLIDNLSELVRRADQPNAIDIMKVNIDRLKDIYRVQALYDSIYAENYEHEISEED